MSRAVDKVVILDGIFPHLSYIAVCEDTRVVMSRYDGLNEIPAVLKHRHHLTGLRVHRVFLHLFNDASFLLLWNSTKAYSCQRKCSCFDNVLYRINDIKLSL